MSNTLIDLEGLKAFYTKVLTEDLSEYARYDSLVSPAIIAPTLVGGMYMISITNNDSRPLTFYWGPDENLDKNNLYSFDDVTRIGAGEIRLCSTDISGVYYVKAYADDGTESPVYTVSVTGRG